MSLNDNNNIINRISKMSTAELKLLDLKVFLVSKANSTDNYFYSKKEYIDTEVQDWIKSNIKKELSRLKRKGEDQEDKFFIDNYNLELTKKDYIAKLKLETDLELKEKKDKLLQSIELNQDILDSEIKLQVIKLTLDKEHAYLIYYRGIKLSAITKSSRSRMPTIRHRDKLVAQKNDVVEFGGKIELIIQDDLFYIISPRTLEYTFDYDDHISVNKNRNLDAITNMSFFKEDPNVDIFIEKSDQYMISRRLAGIDSKTLKTLEKSFVERCNELKEIKENIPNDYKKKKIYLTKFGVLWPLLDHIDVIEKKIKIDPDKSIEPLIYFISDKIVESFLTKELREGN